MQKPSGFDQTACIGEGLTHSPGEKGKIMDGIYVLILFLILLLVLGAICGFLALSKVQRLFKRFRVLETEISSLHLAFQRGEDPPPLRPVTNAVAQEKEGNEALKRSS